MQQTLWLRDLFSFTVKKSLTLRNVRVSGQRLIKADCEEEWCTHCLVPPYIWPSLSNSTVIENHPVVGPTDPSYAAFQCTRTLNNFFSAVDAADTALIIENCTLDNIRIRAKSFIFLRGSSSLTISQTNITRMDFRESFIMGVNARAVLLSGLAVAGFNRDHAYVRDYSDDTGLLFLTHVDNFTMVHSVFEDNLLLQNLEFTNSFIVEIGNYDHLVISDCRMQRTMSGLKIYHTKSAQIMPDMLISRCLFEDNFMIGSSFLKITASASVQITITECVFKNNVASDIYFVWIELFGNSTLLLSHCEFLTNWNYLSPNSPYFPNQISLFSMQKLANLTISSCVFWMGNYNSEFSLMTQLVASHLLNPSKELLEDFLEISPQLYTQMLWVMDWSLVFIVNVTLEESNQYNRFLSFFDARPESLVRVDRLITKNITTNSVLEMSNLANLNNPIIIQNSIFQDIKGVAIEIKGENNKTSLYISNCLFAENNSSSRATIELTSVNTTIIATTWWSCFSTYGLVDFIAFSQVQELVFRDCEFLNNSGAETGDITIISGSSQTALSLEISNSSFQDFSGSAINIGNVKLRQANIRACNFTGGRAAYRTGLISTIHTEGLLTLENITFLKYSDSESYLVQINTPSVTAQGKLTRLLRMMVRDCTFRAAVKLEGQLQQSHAETINCTFLRNHGIIIWSFLGVIRDYSSSFEGNIADGYPCYFQDQQSNATFEYTQFRANAATTIPGGCLYLRGQSSAATFTNCLFKDNTASNAAGVMRIEYFAIVQILNSAFLSNSALVSSALYLLNAEVPLLVVNTSFVGNDGDGVVHLVNSKLNLERVVMSRNKGINAGGLVLVNSEVSVIDSLFSELSGKQGCALVGDSGSNVTLEATKVVDMYCAKNMMDLSSGSSLFLINCQLANLVSDTQLIDIQEGRTFQAFSIYMKNIAASTLLSVTQTNVTVLNSVFSDLSGQVIASRDGALLSIKNSSLSNVNASETALVSCSGVQVIEMQRVRITTVRTGEIGIYMKASEIWVEGCTFERILGGKYGALVLQDSKLKLSDSLFLANRALAPNSYGGAISLLGSSAVITGCSFISNSAYTGGAIYWSLLPPQRQDNIFITNRAYYGPVIASTTHKLQVFNISSLVLASGQTFTSVLLVGCLDTSNQLVTAESSKSWLKSAELSGNMEAKAQKGLLRFTKFVVEAPPDQTVSIVVNTNATVANINVGVRHCRTGEILEKDRCVVCPPSTFSVDFLDCSRCPSGGVCPGDGNLYPEPSYWRPTETYNGVFACGNGAACEGHSYYTNQLGKCAELYEGKLCQKCATGAGRNGPDKCATCPSPVTNYIIIAAALAVSVTIIVILTRSALKSAQRESSLAGTIMKILLNYVQITTLIIRFPLNWPPLMDQFFAFHEYSGNSGEQYMSVDCLVSDSVFKGIIVMAALPLALPVICALLWFLMYTFYSLFRQSIRVRERWVCSTIVSLLYFHPMIMRTTFSALHCFTILPGQQWLRVELTIRCWTDEHSFYALAVALPASVLWGVCIPNLVLLLLIRYRKRLQESRVLIMVGYLCTNYKTKFFFWEVIIMYRKLSVVLLLAFSSNMSTATQSFSLALLLSALAVLQFNYSPFKRVPLNSCELLGEVTILMTVYAGLFFQFAFFSTGVDVAIFAVVIILNITFLAYLVKTLFRNKLRRLLNKWRRTQTVKKPLYLLKISKSLYLQHLQKQITQD